MNNELDYPVANPSNIDPHIYRSLILQTMALQYIKHMAHSDEEFSDMDADNAAMATWQTEWANDPAPRSVEDGIEAAHDDLAYWNED